MRNLSLIALILVGCSSFTKNSQLNFSFQNIQQLQIGKNSITEVADRFGKPAQISRADGKETWTYNDYHTDYQRLTMTFDSSSVLQSIIWLPLPNEDEVHIEGIQKYFPAANFKLVPGPDNNPHSISSMVSYVDEKLGMTLVYQKGRNVVEAVVWTDSTRNPATLAEPNSIPYKLDTL